MHISKILFFFGILFLTEIRAFLTPITSKLIVSNLETIVSTKALSESFLKSMRRELDIEWALLQFTPMDIHPSTAYVYASIVITVIYGQWRFYSGSQTKYDKFKKIEKYAREERILRNIIFLIIMIFMKDIETAS